MQRVSGVGAEIDNQMTALCNNHRLQQYLSSSTATKFWAPTYYDNPPQKCKPTPPLCYRKPLVSAIDGQCINRRACKKSAYYIDMLESSTATKFWAPRIWSCDNTTQNEHMKITASILSPSVWLMSMHGKLCFSWSQTNATI